VAARLAMVYLTNRKPDRAIAALRTTASPILRVNCASSAVAGSARAKRHRRHDLALDIISNIAAEAIRLRSDIYWRRGAGARRPNRSNCITPIAGATSNAEPVEKGDVIRALVGYALAQDVIGLARFREKYAPLMSGDDDRAAFETRASRRRQHRRIRPIAKMAASVDTLDGSCAK